MTSPQKHRSYCPIARSLDVLGDKWTLVIMRDALLFDRRTFAEFSASRENIPTNILSNRLKRLVELELLEKVPYQQQPTRYEYVPTAKGRRARPILTALKNFGEDHLGGRAPKSSR
jgi:DNA-binding HxlR family transcriptional regulator